MMMMMRMRSDKRAVWSGGGLPRSCLLAPTPGSTPGGGVPAERFPSGHSLILVMIIKPMSSSS